VFSAALADILDLGDRAQEALLQSLLPGLHGGVPLAVERVHRQA
jgi:hypothetical protein